MVAVKVGRHFTEQPRCSSFTFFPVNVPFFFLSFSFFFPSWTPGMVKFFFLRRAVVRRNSGSAGSGELFSLSIHTPARMLFS